MLSFLLLLSQKCHYVTRGRVKDSILSWTHVQRKFGNWPSSLIHHVLKVLRFGRNSQILQANLVFPRDCRLFIIGPSRQRMGAKLRSEKNSFCLSVHRRLGSLNSETMNAISLNLNWLRSRKEARLNPFS